MANDEKARPSVSPSGGAVPDVLAEDEYRAVLRLLSEYVFRLTVKPDGSLSMTMASERLADATGRTLDQVREMTDWARIVHPEDAQRFFATVAQVARGGGRCELEGRFLRENGSYRFVHVVADGIRNPVSGRIESIIGAVADISERKHAELELHRMSRALNLLLERMTDAVFSLDTDWRVIYCNDAALALFRRTREQMRGIGWAEIVPDAPEQLTWQQFRKAMATQQSVSFDDFYGLLDLWVSARAFPSAEGLTVIVTDITERKRAQEERDRLQENVRQAEKMAAIGQLAGGIAHDFNNQLTGILGYAELLGDLVADARLRDYASAIATCAKHSAELTRQLLAFARKGCYQVAAIDVCAILRDVAALLRRSVDKRITICDPTGGTPVAGMGDAAQLHHAFLNLAINACDAMPDGGTLSLGCEPIVLDQAACEAMGEIVPGPYARVAVTDSGIGMSEDVRRHLFEPFFTTKPPGKGTGMGLAAVYGIVRRHQGAIVVDSQPGRGTTFHVFLPVASGSGTEVAAVKPRVLASGLAHVLVVDDEAVVLRLMATALRERGYRVTACGTGAEALAAFGETWREIGLVVLDMVMPGMNGVATLAALRRINPDVRVLLTSGFAPAGHADEVDRAGVCGFLPKPFAVDELAAQVGHALALRR
jgi:two-component system, cell cycle sensor histidine kinase and response regulator CckA